MIEKLVLRIGGHSIGMTVSSAELAAYVKTFFLFASERPEAQEEVSDLQVFVEGGYGESFVNFEVEVSRESSWVTYRRMDYRIDIDPTHRQARVFVRDVYALKHALLNLYSAFVVFHDWGLLIHSSCVIEDGYAHLFAGHSGAGKSTIAALSRPRSLLSDEATIIHVTDDGVHVFNSPFRSDGAPVFDPAGYLLSSINLLHQSAMVHRERLKAPDAMLNILDKVFYWPADGADAMKIARILQRLVLKVPTFRLYFQLNPSFWESIS